MFALQPNKRLGEFQIVRFLGKGGMGQVYEAQQLNPSRPVALKVLAPWLAEDDEALERFWREAEVPARLDHPAIVRIISTGKAEGIAYYAMNLVRGVSLADLIRRSRESRLDTADVPTTPAGDPGKHSLASAALIDPPPALLAEYKGERWRFVARYGAVAARALAHAHDQGFLHRDVKPSNVMIDHHGQLYLVDFGLTRALDPADGTRHGVIRGTPWYMSPEQARGDIVDERSDIYGLGVTLYELLTRGEGPFTAERDNSAAILQQVRAGQHLPLRVLAPDLPPALEKSILRAMHFRPQKRHASAAQLAAELEALAGQTAPTLLPAPARRRRRPLLIGTAVLLLLALAVGGSFWLFSHTGTTAAGPGTSDQVPVPPEVARSVPLKDFFQRDRPFNARTPLLREDCQPILSRLLLGRGGFAAAPTGALLVQSPLDNLPTTIALDCVPRGGFEFSIELRQMRHQGENANDLGVFFGWNDPSADPLELQRFFLVHFDERPTGNHAHGQVTVSTAQFVDRQGARSGLNLFTPLPKGKGLLLLPRPAAGPEGWHTVKVRVSGTKVKLQVDDVPPNELDVAGVVSADPKLKNTKLSPRGALGVWVRNGLGSFRNATVMNVVEAE